MAILTIEEIVMYIKTTCLHCGKTNLHDVTIHCIEESNVVDGSISRLYVLENINVKDTVREEDLAKSIFKTLIEHKKLNTDKEGLVYILKDIFRLSAELANEIAEKIEAENEVLVSEFKSNLKASKAKRNKSVVE